MREQSKASSFIEASANTLIGFIMSYVLQLILNEVYMVQMSHETALWFVVWFTIGSIVRSYVIRRYFNFQHKEKK